MPSIPTGWVFIAKGFAGSIPKAYQSALMALDKAADEKWRITEKFERYGRPPKYREAPPGFVICRCRLDWGKWQVLAAHDASLLLVDFACWCVETAIQRENVAGQTLNELFLRATEAKRAWLQKKLSDDDLDKTAMTARYAYHMPGIRTPTYYLEEASVINARRNLSIGDINQIVKNSWFSTSRGIRSYEISDTGTLDAELEMPLLALLEIS